MKLFLSTTLLFLVACSGEKKETLIMPNAYMMVSQSVKSNTVDTTYLTLQQLKVYTGDYMMYANFYARDSASAFGIGSYSAEKDTVTEHVIYSAQDSVKDDTARTYKLFIEQQKDSGYKQVIPDMGTQTQKIILTEVYKAVGTPAKSPVDGVWQESKTYYVKGKDTTKYNTKQFKAYYAGYYLWGHTFSDSTRKNHTGMGYGKFVMNGDNKLTESCLVSSYYRLRGQDNVINIEMNGPDEYTQTINYPNNEKSVETYTRLK